MIDIICDTENRNNERKKERLTIKVKYLTDKIDKLEYVEGKKSDWIDLRAAKDIRLSPGESTKIPLGVAMKLPDGYEANMVPRSSTFDNYGIIQTNGMGIIDEIYCGSNDEWMMPVYALRDCVIHTNNRICQFKIVKKEEPRPKLETVIELEGENRGGFGSTGR